MLDEKLSRKMHILRRNMYVEQNSKSEFVFIFRLKNKKRLRQKSKKDLLTTVDIESISTNLSFPSEWMNVKDNVSP